MTKKEIGRCIAFVLVAGLLLLLLSDLFELDNRSNYDMRFTTFRTLAEDTVDVVWIGTSGVDRYWMAPKAYEEYGMTVYTLSADAMPTWLFTYVIDEAYTYQTPQMIIVDARAFGQDNTDQEAMDARARRVLDAMHLLSVNRFKAGLRTMKVMADTFEEQSVLDMSYLLPYIKHHGKWSEDNYTVAGNLGSKDHFYLGFYMDNKQTAVSVELDPVMYSSDLYEPLDPLTEESLHELLAYAQERNIALLFVDTPQYKNEKEMGRANALYRILDKYGVPYMNFCETDSERNFIHTPEIDPKRDFYNAGHANFYGAQKFTDVMAAYLDENYDLPDHREDIAVREDWDGMYAKIKNRVAKWAK